MPRRLNKYDVQSPALNGARYVRRDMPLFKNPV